MEKKRGKFSQITDPTSPVSTNSEQISVQPRFDRTIVFMSKTTPSPPQAPQKNTPTDAPHNRNLIFELKV